MLSPTSKAKLVSFTDRNRWSLFVVKKRRKPVQSEPEYNVSYKGELLLRGQIYSLDVATTVFSSVSAIVTASSRHGRPLQQRVAARRLLEAIMIS